MGALLLEGDSEPVIVKAPRFVGVHRREMYPTESFFRYLFDSALRNMDGSFKHFLSNFLQAILSSEASKSN
jgi:hypothetical protein